MSDLYPLKPFRIEQRDTLVAILRQYPLLTLFTGEAGSSMMSLIPVLVEEGDGGRLYLLGHLDKNNAQVKSLEVGHAVSFHCKGPDAYASPDLYDSVQLPGWLYVSVQGQGEVVSELNADECRQLLLASSLTFGGAHQSFQLRADDPRVDRFLPFIHGFKIAVSSINGIAKLAQDKGEVDSRRAMMFLSNLDNTNSQPLFKTILQQTLSKKIPEE